MDLLIVMFIYLTILKGIIIHGTDMTKTGNALTFYAQFDDVMYPTAHHTIGFPRRMSLNACAELCFSRSFLSAGMTSVSNINMLSETNGTRDNAFIHENQSGTKFILDESTRQPIKFEEGVTCQAFEYIVSLGYCVLLNTSAAFDNHGYTSLHHAVGTTYFELGKDDKNLFLERKNQTLNEPGAYSNIFRNYTLTACAHACLQSRDLTCNSFAYSGNLNVCGISRHLTKGNYSLVWTPNYNFYQYSGDWPCNASIGYNYEPRVIASQNYPYVNKERINCVIRLTAPPGEQIILHVTMFFTNQSSCDNTNDGVFIYTSETNGSPEATRLCQTEDNFQHPVVRSVSGVLRIRMVQTDTIIITKMAYRNEKLTNCDYSGCLNGATCSPNHHGYICKCAPGYSGKYCEQRISPCSRSPCLFGGICKDHSLTFKCKCPNGTVGDRCETYVGQCFENPCVNGICSPVTSGLGYKCACAIGYTGNNCEYNINECFSSPCVNGKCQDLIGGYKCICESSFTGRHCEIDQHLAECSGHVCQYGTCAINVSGSFCQCFPGFTGRYCDTNVNDCQTVPCAHGVCKDHVNSYSCHCHNGYVGRHCDISSIDPCKHSPCIHGYCSVDTIGYKCECEHGYAGTHCEAKLLGCDKKCVHSLCIDANDKIQTCQCSPESSALCNALNKSNHTPNIVQGNKSSLMTPASSSNIDSYKSAHSSTERTTKTLSTLLDHIHNRSPNNVPLNTKKYPNNLSSTSVVAIPASTGQTITEPNQTSNVSDIIDYYSSKSVDGVTFGTTHLSETTLDVLNPLISTMPTWSHHNIWSHTPPASTKYFGVNTKLSLDDTTLKVPTTSDIQSSRRNNQSNIYNVKLTKTPNHLMKPYSQIGRTSHAGGELSYGKKLFSKIQSTSATYIKASSTNKQPVLALHKGDFTTTKLGTKSTHKTPNVKPTPLTFSTISLVPKTTETRMSAPTQTIRTTVRGPVSLISGHKYPLLQSTTPIYWWRSISNNNMGTTISMVPYTTSPIQNQNDSVSDVCNDNDVITIESILIGALIVTLLIVTGLGSYLFYKKTRSGAVYITSPEIPTRLGDTSVKKRYSSRDIHTELKSGQLFQPRYVSSEFCGRNATSSVKLTRSSTPMPSSSATSSLSTRDSWNYDDVESPVLSLPSQVRTIGLRKGNSHVTLSRGHGVVSSNNPNETSTQSYRSFDEVDDDINFSGDENPFFENPDGTISLNLSKRHHSCKQEKFEVYLQDIIERNQRTSYSIPGTRKSVYYITGTSDGKSEV